MCYPNSSKQSRSQLLILCAISLLGLSLTGCNPSTEEIADLVALQQDHTAYLEGKNIAAPMVSEQYQHIMHENFKERFYRPWGLKKSSQSKETLENQLSRFSTSKGYGENKLAYTPEFFEGIKNNARLDKFPNYIRTAITISNTNMRLLPTHKPYFKELDSNSGGFPFDTFQVTALPANTPLLITHISKDNAWVYIETSLASGWVSIQDVAYTDSKFMTQFQNSETFVALVKENIPILTTDGLYLYNANIGCLFPKTGETNTHYFGNATVVGKERTATLRKIKLAKSLSAETPIVMSIAHVAQLSNELLGQPYGWGGLYRNRDCSAMIRDLFIPFGLWLPRNSSSQAHRGGTYIDLLTLSPEKREEMIIRNGVPYLTLLWLPGHIMLYIGEKEGRALVFHNIWGLRTKDTLTRKIIGKSVITTLEPGKELKKIDPKMNLLQRVEGLTLLTPGYPQ